MRRSLVAPLYLIVGLAAASPAAAQMMGGPYARGDGNNTAAAAPAGNAAHGRQLAAGTCAACHRSDGNSTDPQYPKLAGQNATYLYDQLLAFKAKTRPSAVMAPLAATLSDQDAVDLARFFSAQPVKPDPIEDRALARTGESIFTGSGSRGAGGAPPCAMCHSAAAARMPMMGMMGVNPATIPNLYGQHAAYIVDQLDKYASGERPDGVMNQIAAGVGAADRKAVAAYLAGLR